MTHIFRYLAISTVSLTSTQMLEASENCKIEFHSNVARSFLAESTAVEILTDGYHLAEGPVWNTAEECLLFTDLLTNSIYQWTKKEGASLYLFPSGRTGFAPSFEEGVIGANGLGMTSDNSLVLCQHGDRRIARLINKTGTRPIFVTLASHFQNKRLNSPNDLAIAANGDIYFTDPPGGFIDWAASDLANKKVVVDERNKELNFHGVYHYHHKTGKLSLVSRDMSRPNGIALSRDQKHIYVGNAERKRPYITRFSTEDYTGKMFFDGPFRKGKTEVIDGMKVHVSGLLFTTGPGGIYLLSSTGKKLAVIHFDHQVTNVCFGPDQKYLYLTTFNYVARLRLKTLRSP